MSTDVRHEPKSSPGRHVVSRGGAVTPRSGAFAALQPDLPRHPGPPFPRQTPIGYLTSWRLTLAANVVTETDTPLEAVARQVGYGDAFALSAAFKRVSGIAPAITAGRTTARLELTRASRLRVARVPNVYEGWGNWLQTQKAPEAGARASGPFRTGPQARTRCLRSTISWF